MCYLQFFPAPYHSEGNMFGVYIYISIFWTERFWMLVLERIIKLQFIYLYFSGWGPYAYFRALEETNSRSTVGHPADGVHMQPMEIQDFNQQSRRNGTFRQVSLSDPMQDVEAGKM
ncbi:hypothetical protein HanHA300_Chr08g0267561 [Helianthus annuus]|nr:hypothetical protein HanHA300_Chr08g0267561 [Helianthus annuus]KAJ0721294.1 hypothetical protein HanOQP8_Chr08g0273981 [Helianthus annuus]